MGSAERCPLQAAGEVTEGCSPLGDLTCLGRPDLPWETFSNSHGLS